MFDLWILVTERVLRMNAASLRGDAIKEAERWPTGMNPHSSVT